MNKEQIGEEYNKILMKLCNLTFKEVVFRSVLFSIAITLIISIRDRSVEGILICIFIILFTFSVTYLFYMLRRWIRKFNIQNDNWENI